MPSTGRFDSTRPGPRRSYAGLWVGACALLGACDGVQSALAPKGPVARALAETWWILLIGASAIFVLVMALVLYAVLRAPERRHSLRGNWLIVAGGMILPVTVLSALLVYAVRVSDSVQAAPSAALRIEVVGHQWWWEVRYPGQRDAVTANEIHIPAGRAVVIELQSADVIHSFWVPSLAGKIDVLPEQRNRVVLQADRPGVYRGQCAEFCGAQHARMALLVIAQPPEEFAAWLTRQAAPAREPTTPAQARGRAAFLQHDCINCHTVRGTTADGRQAPDLTHVGGRRTLAALTLSNTRANLFDWITDSQAIKPGNAMPSFRHVGGAARADIAAFLESLE